MIGPASSPVWYRVADLCPALSPHAELSRHVYRGKVQYIVRDAASGRSHLFTRSTRAVLVLMNGSRTVAEILAIAGRQLGDQAPTQAEMIALLRQLHRADLLRTNLPADTDELADRASQHETSRKLRSFSNPLAIQLRLFDPDTFLSGIAPLLRRIWSRTGAFLWLAIVVPAVLLIPPHWAELTGDMTDRVLSVSNLFVLYLMFPVLKAWHELGHATAIKSRDGEVHDMGVILLGLLPVPYVDASMSTTLRSKYDRALIGAAGMMAELLVAALAFYAWLLVEPGLFRAVLFNIMITAGISTLIFNGNPLLRYDAYYILSDLTEVPNLAARSARCWQYLWYRFAVGMEEPIFPVASKSEMPWLLAYGVASSLYRVLVTSLIALFIAGKFFFIGVLVALWAVGAMVFFPVARGLRHTLFSPNLHGKRRRATTVALCLIGGVAAFLFLIPVPYATTAIGVVWPPDKALVRAGTDGVVNRFLVVPGKPVAAGTPLISASNPELGADIQIVEANIEQLRAAYRDEYAAHSDDLPRTRAQIDFAKRQLQTLEQLASELVVKARIPGRFIVPEASDLPGRYLRKGDLIGYIVGKARPIIRVVVSQASIDEISLGTDRIEVRVADQPDRVITGRVIRSVPNGASVLPSLAFSPEGGGPFPVDPRDSSGIKTLQRTFQFDVLLNYPGSFTVFGEHAYVRFIHAPQPLAPRLFRAIRLLFLSRLTD